MWLHNLQWWKNKQLQVSTIKELLQNNVKKNGQEENTRNQLLSKENTLVMLMTIREESPSRIPIKDIWSAWKSCDRNISIKPPQNLNKADLYGLQPGKSQMFKTKYANSLSTVCILALNYLVILNKKWASEIQWCYFSEQKESDTIN